MRKRLAILLVFIMLFSSLIPITSALPPLSMVSGPYLKYDTGIVEKDGFTVCTQRIPNSQYLLVINYASGGGGLGQLYTYRVWNNNGTVQNKQISTFATGRSMLTPSMVHVSGTGGAAGDIYLIREGASSLITIRVWGSNGTIQQKFLDTQSGLIGGGGYNITRVSPNTNIYVTAGNSLETYSVDNNTGDISDAPIDTEAVGACQFPTLTMVDKDTVAINYRDGCLNIKTYTITTAGAISSVVASYSSSTPFGAPYHNGMVRVNSSDSRNIFLLAANDVSTDYLDLATYNISSDGTSIAIVNSYENYASSDHTMGTGLWTLGWNQFAATYFSRDDGYVKAKFLNCSNAGVVSTAFKSWNSGVGDMTSAYDFKCPVSNVGNYLYTLAGYDNDEHLNLYTFWRNETAPIPPKSWQAITWNGTLWNDTLWQKHDWNGTLKNTTLWQQRADWNGTLWNNSRVWRTTFLNERFTLAANNAPSVTDTSWRGQSFTIGKTGENINYYLNHVALNLRKDATTDPALLYTVRVYAADSDHKPTGAVLCSGTINTWRATTSFSWINVTFNTSPLLTAGGKYVIVLFKNAASGYNIRWGTRNNATAAGSASYTGGYSITSSNSGGTWSLATGIDCDFMVWGSTLSDWPPIWNGTLYNVTVAWKLGADWNGTLWNLTLWSTHGLWNGTLWNFSHGYAILVSQWNGTLYNDTLWANIQIWNGTLYNSTYFNLLQLWNGSLWNSTHWMPVIAVWNGTLTSVVHLILHVHGNGWVSRSPVFIPYSLGDTVNCTATAGMLYLFHDIMGVTATNLYVVTLDKDRVVYANFTTNTSTGYDFTYTDDTDLPKITDVVNANSSSTDGIFEWSRVFTYAWVWALGGWFFALILGVIGGAIFLQYKRMEVVAAYFIIVLILFGAVTSSIGYVAGILVALILGFLIYRVLKIKR